MDGPSDAEKSISKPRKKAVPRKASAAAVAAAAAAAKAAAFAATGIATPATTSKQVSPLDGASPSPPQYEATSHLEHPTPSPSIPATPKTTTPTAPAAKPSNDGTSNAKGSAKRRRKANEDGGAEPKKSKKEQKSKAKSAKAVGPVDLDRQCGVIGPPNYAPCTRAITCKSHSVLAKRSVLGRSRGYDDLVSIYQSRVMEKRDIFGSNANSLWQNGKGNHGKGTKAHGAGPGGSGLGSGATTLPELPPDQETKAILDAVENYLQNPDPLTNGPLATRTFPMQQYRADRMFAQMLDDVLPTMLDAG